MYVDPTGTYKRSFGHEFDFSFNLEFGNPFSQIFNQIKNSFIIFWEDALLPIGNWLWDDVLKPASHSPIVNGIIAIGGLGLTIASGIISAPVLGTVILVAGVIIGVLGVILWFRTLFD